MSSLSWKTILRSILFLCILLIFGISLNALIGNINSIKAEFYDKNKFKETSKFIKLCYEYPDLSYDFYWLLRARSGYRLDVRIAKAAKIIDQMCPNFCPCCKSNKQWISHWLIDCPFFNHIRSKVNEKFYFYIMLFIVAT